MTKKLEEEDIKEILKKVICGHTNSFNTIILSFEREVFSLSLRLLKNREEAEEASQDAFVRAFQNIRSFKGESRFSTWLYKIVYNTCLNRLRKNKREVKFVLEDVYSLKTETKSDIWDSLKSKERSYYLKMALEKLNEDEQLFITLYYQHERTILEIREITGVNENLIKVKLFRSRQKLEKILLLILPAETKNLY
jgi:RNA polymerase sigma-70 factor (ECF subfamily)